MKRVFKWLGWILLAFLLLISPRILTIIRFSGKAHVPQVHSDFTALPHVAPTAGAKITHVYQGLPHNYFDSDFNRAVLLTHNFTLHGYPFYSDKLTPDANTLDLVAKRLKDNSAYSSYSGPKLCGGYHADFVARFLDDNRRVDVLVCLGCEEVLLFSSDGNELICELTEQAHNELVSLFKLVRRPH
jgi:hypothetical protein